MQMAEEEEDLNAMMKSYYGVDDSSAIDSIYDLNSVEYDVDLHVQKLIREESTLELLTVNNQIYGEIKALCSEQQMIVYENYNKYMAATDTIHSMKSHVDLIDVCIHGWNDSYDSRK